MPSQQLAEPLRLPSVVVDSPRDKCLRVAGSDSAPDGFAYADLLRSELNARITEWQHTVLDELHGVTSEHSRLTSALATCQSELASVRAAADDTRRIFLSRLGELEARLASALAGKLAKLAEDVAPIADKDTEVVAGSEDIRHRIQRDSSAVIRSTAALQRSLLAQCDSGCEVENEEQITEAFCDVLRLADDFRRHHLIACKLPCAAAEASDHSMDSTPEVAGRRSLRRGNEPRPPPPMRAPSLSALGSPDSDEKSERPRMRRSPKGSTVSITLPRLDDEPAATSTAAPCVVKPPTASQATTGTPPPPVDASTHSGAAAVGVPTVGALSTSQSPPPCACEHQADFARDSSAESRRSLTSASREVSFRVICSHTRHGLHVRVVGSCSALGSWNPKQGHVLHTSPGEFPTWRSLERMVLEDCPAIIEYKYIICDSDASYILWEGGVNRTINLAEVSPRQAKITVNETYGAVSECVSDRIRCASQSLIPHQDMACGEEDDDDLDCESNWSSLVREESYSQMHAVLVESDTDTPAKPEVVIGKEFEQRYRLLGRGPLGEGTFGLVWSCQALDVSRSSEELAAKIIRKSTLQPRDVEHLLGEYGEVRTHMTLRHPHIVTLHEYFDESNTVTLILECCSGGDLFDALNREWPRTGRGFLEPAAARVMQHTLSALAHIHGHNVVHRDLKCENVLMSMGRNVPAERNVFKLCDFGFSAYDDGSNTLTARVGSPYTVAPEVVAGKPYGSRVDMWSIGVVMYMTLAAQSPFYAPSNSRVLRLVLAGSYSLANGIWPSVSPVAKSLLTSLMVVDPTARWTAQQALTSDWLIAATGSPC